MLALCMAMPPRLWKQKITTLNCSKHLGEAVRYIQRKSSWLLKRISKGLHGNWMKEGKILSSFKSILYSTAVNYFLLFQWDKTRPREFVQCHSSTLERASGCGIPDSWPTVMSQTASMCQGHRKLQEKPGSLTNIISNKYSMYFSITHRMYF